MSKSVIVFKPKKNTDMTIRQFMVRMDRYRSKHPNRDVFFDGDEWAICYIR